MSGRKKKDSPPKYVPPPMYVEPSDINLDTSIVNEESGRVYARLHSDGTWFSMQPRYDHRWSRLLDNDLQYFLTQLEVARAS